MLMFHQENVRSHTTRITSQKIEKLGLEKIPHPPYSPSDYHLFRSLKIQNYLEKTAFLMKKHVETDICEFFESMLNKF